VKDDHELNAILLNNAIDEVRAVRERGCAATARLWPGDALAPVHGSAGHHQRWSRRYDARLLEQLIYAPTLSAEAFASSDTLARLGPCRWSKRSTRRTIHRQVPDRTTRRRGRHGRRGRSARALHRTAQRATATVHEKALPREFFTSAGIRRHRPKLGKTLAGMIGEGAYVVSGSPAQEVGSFKEAIHWLFEQARKGQTMQRYKGLGEMNPDQLWETTINPENAPAAAGAHRGSHRGGMTFFNTLMGDQVEPRREFIEKNAAGGDGTSTSEDSVGFPQENLSKSCAKAPVADLPAPRV